MQVFSLVSRAFLEKEGVCPRAVRPKRPDFAACSHSNRASLLESASPCVLLINFILRKGPDLKTKQKNAFFFGSRGLLEGGGTEVGSCWRMGVSFQICWRRKF